jgi:hypothetical protein
VAQGRRLSYHLFHSFASLTPDFHPATRKSSARRYPSLPKSGKPGALVSGAPVEVRGLKGPFFHRIGGFSFDSKANKW